MAKRKFRFNAIDAIIILIVLAACAVFGYVFMSDSTKEEEPPAEKVKIQYVLQTFETREQYVGNIAESDIIYEDGTGKVLGTVVSVTHEPAYYTGVNGENAMQVISEIEGKRNMFITIETEAEPLKNGFSVDGNVFVVGGVAKFVTPNLIANSNIISIEVIG